MENTKVWAPIVVLGIILVGFFCFSYFEKVDKANASFQNSQLITEQAHQSLVTRQQMLEARGRSAAENQTAVQRLKSADDRLKAAEQLMADADKKQRQTEGDMNYLVGAMPTIRQKAWEAAIGTEFAELKLENGKVLKSAKIRKVADDSVTFIHAEGIGSIPIADLPKELQSRFDLGESSLLRRLEQLAESLVAKVEKKPLLSAPPSPSSSPPAASGMSEADAKRYKELKFREADLQAKLAAAKQNQQNWQTHLQRLTTEISNAKERGVPTTGLREDYQKASGSAAASLSGIQAIDADLRKVQAEIDILKVRTL